MIIALTVYLSVGSTLATVSMLDVSKKGPLTWYDLIFVAPVFVVMSPIALLLTVFNII